MKAVGPKGYLSLSEIAMESETDKRKRYAAMRREDEAIRKLAAARERVELAEHNLATSEAYQRRLGDPSKSEAAVERRRYELQRAEEKAMKIFSSMTQATKTQPDVDPAELARRNALLHEAIELDNSYNKRSRKP